jgi:HD superfamily phosphohydrolase
MMGKKSKQATEEFDHEAFLRQAEAVMEQFRVDVVRPFQAFALAVVESLAPAMEKFFEAAKQMYNVVYQHYLDCGAIYGNNPEGFERWLNELGEANRLEEEARRIRQRHEDLADLKRLVEGERGR